MVFIPDLLFKIPTGMFEDILERLRPIPLPVERETLRLGYNLSDMVPPEIS